MRLYLGEFEEVVLLLVVVYYEDVYGLFIRNLIEEKFNRKVMFSSVYIVLY